MVQKGPGAASHSLNRLRENLAGVKQKTNQKSRSLYQDVTCNQSTQTILV